MGGRCGDACDMSKVVEESWRGRERITVCTCAELPLGLEAG
jgi:hypothetical protein